MLGKKIGMTQFFDESGKQVAVTVVEIPDNVVLQVKGQETDGYDALKLGAYDKKEKLCTKAEIGASAKAKPCRFVKEVRLSDAAEVESGASLNMAETFDGVEKIKVVGTSKGKGFAGVMKRHNFGGYRATHGVKTHHRHPGSIGQCAYPGRVFKGKKMPGHMGNERVSQKGLKIVKMLPEKNLMLIKGSVPGANGGYLIVEEDQGYKPPAK
jgi:large subunit ribosomal protein L3